ncbi:MAG: DUF2238 domain-containing protein [Pirellulales bacterium]|nr:DUF2238 domain-containing protein [Pirellulales bacterium]
MKIPYLLLAVTICLTLLSLLNAPYPKEQWLQHAPTAVAYLLMAVGIGKRWLSTTSWVMITVFWWLHILGARWIYSSVPYDDWSEYLLGFRLNERFGWTRNHYDRLVHLASGILFAWPAAETLQRYGGMKPLGAAVVSIAVVLAIGAVYEVLEWQVAVTFSPQQAEAYNGQQGDIWDPQKDLALAWLGAMLAAGLLWRHDFNPNRRDRR